MASITTWHRLEPRSRSEALSSVAARVADPLWMIARQWQSGELAASDRGSPISVSLTAEHSLLTRWLPGTAAAGVGQPLPPDRVIEDFADSVRPRIGLIDRARGGHHFLRLLAGLAARYAQGYRAAFPLPPLTAAERDASDARGLRWSQLLTGRALDGAALRAVLGPADAPILPAAPAVDAGDRDQVLHAARSFVLWWDEQFPQRQGSWTARRLAAHFQLGAATSWGPFGFVASEHRGGGIDWHSLDVAFGTGIAVGDPPSAASAPAVSLPTRLAFPGMPRPRWWEFEDAAVDLGRIDAAPDDLGRLLLAEFALIYGNDFFAIPVEMSVGSMCRVLTLEVETCFGETIAIPATWAFDGATGRSGWRMFACDLVGATSPLPGLVLPPTAVDPLRGEPREEVLLARDEMANVAWAIEIRVAGPAGFVVERREVELALRARRGEASTTDNTARYVLSTTVPDSWMPLVPVAGGALELQGSVRPGGQLLGETATFAIDAVELPRTGRRIRLRPVRARAADGSILMWNAWEATAGRGEASSGLRHDELTHRLPGS